MLNVNNFQNGDTYSGCEMCGNSEKTVWENGFGFYCEECKDEARRNRLKNRIPLIVKVKNIESNDKKLLIFNCKSSELIRKYDNFYQCPDCSDDFSYVNNGLFLVESKEFNNEKLKTFCREHYVCENCGSAYIDPSHNDYADEELIIEYKNNFND